MVYKDIDSIYDKVVADYENDDVELNGAHFDLEVENIKGIELLGLYAEIQLVLNGDHVVRIENPVAIQNAKGYTEITGGKLVELDNGTLNEAYTGNMRTFLRSLEDTGVYRFTELMATDEDVVFGGEPLCFIS